MVPVLEPLTFRWECPAAWFRVANQKAMDGFFLTVHLCCLSLPLFPLVCVPSSYEPAWLPLPLIGSSFLSLLWQ
jgi:hypothetical protein